MRTRLILVAAILTLGPKPALAQPAEPAFLADRGTGVSSSMFGTYIRKGELVLYPFFEFYRDDNYEYKPEDLGAPGDGDYRGRYRAKEGLLLFGYGLSDNIVVEFEAAGITAAFEKAPDDPSALPARIEKSGVGDVEAQLRWRWNRETDRRPEIFSYSEVVFPHHADRVLIGAPGWELKFGTGLTRGFSWGTLTARGALEYSTASSSHFDLGEYALEYLKRLSSHWTIYAGVEGTQDEISAVAEVQWHVSKHVVVKANNGFGLTSKAIDWAPEVGILFSIPVR